MAQRTVVLLEDDLDGGSAEQTVIFALDGVTYEIDLSNINAEKLRGVFGPYALAGRRIRALRPGPAIRIMPRPPGATTSGKPVPRNRTDREQYTAIRTWARARGLPVNDRGRIARHLIDQYNNATASADPTPTSSPPSVSSSPPAVVPAVTFAAPPPAPSARRAPPRS